MPLTEKGKKIMKSMKKQYGKKKGEAVFYASKNKKKIKKVIKGLQKASKTHAAQAKTLKGVIRGTRTTTRKS